MGQLRHASSRLRRNSGAGPAYVPVTPLLADDPPKVGQFWLDARIAATPAGIAFTAHDAANTPAMVILLSEGAAADAAARARLAGEINGCTSTPCWHGVAMGKTPADSAANTAARRTIPLPPTTVPWPRGRRWPTTDRRLQPLRPGRSSTPCRLRRSRRRACRPAPTTSSTGSIGCVRAWRGFGRCRGRAVSTGQVGERF